jgi:competence CoiA-like predicted nuclease
MAGSKELNKYLKELSKDELIKEVNKLHSKFKLVKEYYASELGTDNGKLLETCKDKLAKLILKSGRTIKPDVALANKVIREFASVSVHKVDVIDLMLYKVELCCEFVKQWGYEFPGVTGTITSTYPEIIDLISKNRFEKIFSKRCRQVEVVGKNYWLIADTLNFDEEDEPQNS